MAQIVDSYNESNFSALSAWSSSDTIVGGQSFTGNGGVLNSVKFYLSKNSGSTGNIEARIYAHTGTYGNGGTGTGNVLATSGIIDISTLSTSSGLITFQFFDVNKINLLNGTKYVVVTNYKSGGDGILWVGEDDSSPTHSGNKTWLNGSWYASTNDVIFYIYSDDPTSGIGSLLSQKLPFA